MGGRGENIRETWSDLFHRLKAFSTYAVNDKITHPQSLDPPSFPLFLQTKSRFHRKVRRWGCCSLLTGSRARVHCYALAIKDRLMSMKMRADAPTEEKNCIDCTNLRTHSWENLFLITIFSTDHHRIWNRFPKTNILTTYLTRMMKS